MRTLFVSLTAMALAATLVISGCASSTPAPAPTKAPAAPAQAVEPTKAPAAATAAPAAPTKAAEPTKPAQPAAKTVDFPQKGRAITVIVPYSAGGDNDVLARLIAPMLEKELGVPVQVVNKPGASGQIGFTELAKSRPDGYTISTSPLPPIAVTYLDADRKAVYTRKDFLPLARAVVNVGCVAVKTDSPLKSMKDLVDAAKANPGKLKAATDGIMAEDQFSTLMFQKQAGVEFSFVHFDGGAPTIPALLGGHVDFRFGKVTNFLAQVKAGELRIIGILDKQEHRLYPGVKTLEAQGYPVYFYPSRGYTLPAGTPREVVDVLSAAFKKAMESDDYKKKLDDLGFVPNYQGPQEFAAFWDEMESQIRPLIDMAKQVK